ncbi:MAG TPA: SRPBCC domain-containing protein [bacterium]|jgi:glutathione S-transferase
MVSRAQLDPDTSLTVRRTYPAARERVFRAWTDPAALRAWSCPLGFTVAEVQVDLRVGGIYRVAMQPPDKSEPSVAFGTYREISPPERLVYTWQWEGGEMGETLVTVEFRDLGGETEVVLVHELFPAADVRDLHNEGWVSCLEHLAQALPSIA